MKILGWVLIFLGSNILTGTLVARNSIQYNLLSDYPWIRELAGIAGFVGLDDIAEGIENLQRDIGSYVQLVDILFNIALGVLVLGVILLVIGRMKSAKVAAES